MTSNLEQLTVKSSPYTKVCTPEVKSWVILPLRPAYVDIQGGWKSEISHRTTSERPWALNSKNILHTLSQCPRWQNVWPVLLYEQPFMTYKVAENRKCTERPKIDLQHLIVRSITHILSKYPRCPNLGPLCSTTSRRLQGCQISEELEIHRTTSEFLWTLNGQKDAVYT